MNKPGDNILSVTKLQWVVAITLVGVGALGANAESLSDEHRRALRSRHGMAAEQGETSPGRQDLWQEFVGRKRGAADGRLNRASMRQPLATSPDLKAVVIGCSDDATDLAQLFGQEPQALLVLREPASRADASALASVEDAVARRHASLLVVLGHDRCHAVTSALAPSPSSSPSAAESVAGIRALAAPAQQAGLRDAALADHVVEACVHQTAARLLSESEVVAEAVRGGRLRVVEAKRAADGSIVTLEPAPVPAPIPKRRIAAPIQSPQPSETPDE